MMAPTTAPLGPDAASVRSPSLVSAPSLTRRERQVLMLLATGMSSAEAAGRLHLSLSTVNHGLSALYRTLGTGGLIETYRAIGWLDTTPASLADIEARLAAIHAESGALLAELRSAA